VAWYGTEPATVPERINARAAPRRCWRVLPASCKAVQLGVRLAAVSDPVSADLKTMTGVSGSVEEGDPMPYFQRFCSGASPTLPILKTPRRRDKHHLRFVATRPCLLCGRAPSNPHHLRFAEPRMPGRKVSDEFTVPLCRSHHRALHGAADERAWWHSFGIDPLPVAQKLWNERR
jgi:hypothetical protein